MNIRNIKEKAKQLLLTCKPQYIRILIIVMLITCLGEYLANLNIPTLLVSLIAIIFLPISHGYIVSALKIVRNTSHTLSDEDALVGYKRFKELFPTYVLSFLAQFGILFLIVVVLSIIFSMVLGSVVLSIDNMSQFVSEDPATMLLSLFTFAPELMLVFLLIAVFAGASFYYISLLFFAVPYLLERFHIKNGLAIKESFRFMKGHKMDLFKLDISFLGWALLDGLIVYLLTRFVGSLPFVGYALVLLAGGFFRIYTYYPQYELSRAILFEEIAYQRYGNNRSEGKEPVQEEVVEMTENTVEFNDENREDA